MKLKWFFMIFEWSSAQYPTKIGPSPVLSITRITSPRSELKTKMALTWSREWGFWCSVMSDMWETRKWEMRTNIIFFQISCQNGIVYLWHHIITTTIGVNVNACLSSQYVPCKWLATRPGCTLPLIRWDRCQLTRNPIENQYYKKWMDGFSLFSPYCK